MFNVLVVEPDARVAARLRQSIQNISNVDTQKKFETAKKQLLGAPYHFLVTNLRLADFNGLHLVYLARTTSLPARCIVYTRERDAWLAREVQQAGAFYETNECLPVTLLGYLTGTLPDADRRDAARVDRRSSVRGGRRSWDLHLFSGSA